MSAAPLRLATRWLVTLAIALNVLGRTPLHAEACLSLRVRPLVMITAGDVYVEARIRRHADHRAYDIVVTSVDGNEAISGPYALAGVDGPALVNLMLKAYPAADYVVEVRIYNQSGEVVARARQEVRTADTALVPIARDPTATPLHGLRRRLLWRSV